MLNWIRRWWPRRRFVLCPFHDEQTPSCCVTATGFVCFGCGREGTREELRAAGVEV